MKLGAIARGLKVFDGRSGVSNTARGALQETFVDVPEGAIAGTNRLEDLPVEARAYVDQLAEILDVRVELISTGAERNDTIIPPNSLFAGV